MQDADVRTSVFPKSSRLKSSLRIKNIVQQRRFVFSFPIKCFYEIGTGTGVKIAVIVSKKRFPHATDRNRVKRLMRETYRLNRQRLQIPDHCGVEMCWMYVGAELPSFAQVNIAAEQLFVELQSALNKESER